MKTKKMTSLFKANNVRWALVAICLVLFLDVAYLVRLNPVLEVDTSFSQFLQAQGWAAFLLFTNLVLTSSLFRIIYILLIGYSVVQKRYETGILLAIPWLSQILTLLVKAAIARPRPTAPAVTIYDARSGYSFVSGHTLEYLLFFGILGVLTLNKIKTRPQLRLAAATFFFLMPAVVGLGRIYSGAHWLTDVIGSFLLGIPILLLLQPQIKNALRENNR